MNRIENSPKKPCRRAYPQERGLAIRTQAGDIAISSASHRGEELLLENPQLRWSDHSNPFVTPLASIVR
ncbi:MAG: hypothetical protein ACK44A_09460 [Roseateles sp.]